MQLKQREKGKIYRNCRDFYLKVILEIINVENYCTCNPVVPQLLLNKM